MQPILNVLLTKSVEQALLEVEEETELSEIRAFKAGYQKRQVDLHAGWEEEVKREIQRIKHKNKVLKQARAKRDQQVKTMHKLQCLSLAKNFLKGCLTGTLTHLAEHSYWRDSFQDQLGVAYKNHLVDKSLKISGDRSEATSYLDNLVDTHVHALTAQKEQIRKQMDDTRARLATKRLIESADRRVVHFMFDPKQPVPLTAFSRKVNHLLEGTLEETEKEDAEKIEQYFEKMVNDELEDADVSPFKFEDSPFFELALGNIKNLAFAVADSPFRKLAVQKYYPEAMVVAEDGSILAHIKPDSESSDALDLKYLENFRDDKMRINDDRKIKMNLDSFKEHPGVTILFFVRTFDTRGKKVTEDAFAQSWFRLNNEETNQCLDYTKIASVELPEGYEENAGGEDEEEPAARNELVYLAGRLFRDQGLEERRGGVRWVYEKYTKVTTSESMPNVQ